MITEAALREAFLPPAMLCYFEQKLPAVAPAEVLVRVEETLKFLNMATHLSGDIPVTREIDDVWHLWILETRSYATLCDQLHGRRFIHHTSNVYMRCAAQGDRAPADDDKDAWLTHQVAALAAYVANYGDFAPGRVRYWRLADSLISERGMSLDRLNAWLKTGRAAGHAPPQPTPTTT